MYNSLNPPPIAPLIQGDGFLTTGSLGRSSAQSMWPVRPYRPIITTSEIINLSLEFYNYFIVYSNTPITLSLEVIPIGTLITVEFDGSGSILEKKNSKRYKRKQFGSGSNPPNFTNLDPDPN